MIMIFDIYIYTYMIWYRLHDGWWAMIWCDVKVWKYIGHMIYKYMTYDIWHTIYHITYMIYDIWSNYDIIYDGI